MERREVLGGGLAGILGAIGSADPEAQGSQGASDTAVLREVIDVLRGIRSELQQMNAGCDVGDCGEANEIRRSIVTFVRARGRFPQLVDVGYTVWFRMYDWHVRNRQPLNVTRMPDGRYTLQFMYTRLVLRQESTESFIGMAYDAEEG